MTTFSLTRTSQCAKCPWKKETDPFEIPNGYDVQKHQALSETIAGNGNYLGFGQSKAMACHESGGNGQEEYCVGWLYNQLGEGNNIALRLRMFDCDNIGQIRVFGKQHQTFEDTLPKHGPLTNQD